MDYETILEAIKQYDNMTSMEIQNQVKPIIKSYDKEFLCVYLGVSKEHLYRVCKKLFVENNEHLQFTTYIKIMQLGKNPDYVEKEYKVRKKCSNKTPEERKEILKEYQRKYYEEVTKKKRKMAKLENNN